MTHVPHVPNDAHDAHDAHESPPRRRWLVASASLCALGALVVAPCARAVSPSAPVTTRWLSPGPQIPAVELLDQSGRPHALRSLCQGPVVISFFFTGCSSTCPPQTAALRALREQLVETGATVPMFLSVTLDPLGDTPRELAAYARRFGVATGLEAGWLLLTGRSEALRATWQAFEAPTSQPESHSSLLWIGHGARERWTRASALSPTARLRDLVEAA